MDLSLLSSQRGSKLWLDPRTKLMMLTVVNLVVVSGGYGGIPGMIRSALALLPFFLLLSEQRHQKAVLYLIFIGAAIFGETFLVSRIQGISNLLVVIFCGLISRFVPGLVMGYYVVSTTKIAEFVAALERMHVPQKIIIPLSVMLRFFPTVTQEAAAINDAMRMRGIWFGGNRPGAMLEYRLVPILMCTVQIGEELSAAALTRGLGKPVKRTTVCRIGFGTADWILILITMGAFLSWIVF